MDSITAVPIARRDRPVPRPVGKADAAGRTLSKFGLINFAREKRGVATAAAKTSGAEGGGTVTDAAAAIASHRGRREMFYEQATSSLRGAKQCGCAVRRSGPPSLLRHPQFGRPHRVASPMDPSATASIHPSIPIPLSIEFSKDESLCPSIHSIPLAVSFVGVKLHLGRASERG